MLKRERSDVSEEVSTTKTLTWGYLEDVGLEFSESLVEGRLNWLPSQKRVTWVQKHIRRGKECRLWVYSRLYNFFIGIRVESNGGTDAEVMVHRGPGKRY